MAMATMGSATSEISTMLRRREESTPLRLSSAACLLMRENMMVVSGTISTPSRKVISL